MRISCQQTILMKYAIFIIFEKAAKFEIVVCCKLEVVLYGLITPKFSQKVCVCVCVCVIVLPDGPYFDCI